MEAGAQRFPRRDCRSFDHEFDALLRAKVFDNNMRRIIFCCAP